MGLHIVQNSPTSGYQQTIEGDINATNLSAVYLSSDNIFTTTISTTQIYQGTGTPVLYVDANKVGINTTIPNNDLTIQGSVSSTGVIYTSNDIHITDATKGLILTSPASGDWRITVTNSGTLSTTPI